jgi:RHS repeat-associated protein
MKVGGVQSAYIYDAAGNKVRATRGAVTTKYYYDHTGKLLFEADGSGTVLNFYYYQDSRMVAMGSAAGASYFYHHDKNGNTVAMTDASGTVVNAYAYTPYGEIAGSTETVANRFKYVGGYGVMDEGGGIYFMKNRYYDASAGRFLQKDPIGFEGGQSNLYAYVAGNPVTGIDPMGLMEDAYLFDEVRAIKADGTLQHILEAAGINSDSVGNFSAKTAGKKVITTVLGLGFGEGILFGVGLEVTAKVGWYLVEQIAAAMKGFSPEPKCKW